jgi:hypothetical protein
VFAGASGARCSRADFEKVYPAAPGRWPQGAIGNLARSEATPWASPTRRASSASSFLACRNRPRACGSQPSRRTRHVCTAVKASFGARDGRYGNDKTGDGPTTVPYAARLNLYSSLISLPGKGRLSHCATGHAHRRFTQSKLARANMRHRAIRRPHETSIAKDKTPNIKVPEGEPAAQWLRACRGYPVALAHVRDRRKPKSTPKVVVHSSEFLSRFIAQ